MSCYSLCVLYVNLKSEKDVDSNLLQALILSQTSLCFYVSAVQVHCRKHCRKRRKSNEQFLLFPQCFLPVWRTVCHIHQIQNCRLQTLSVWKSLKFVFWESVTSVPQKKMLDWSKFKAYADNKSRVTQMMQPSPDGSVLSVSDS